MKIRHWILLVFVALAVAAMFMYKQGMLLMKYCFALNWSKTKVNKIGANGIDIVLGIDIKNNSDLLITVAGYKFIIYINGKEVSQVVNNDKFNWEPHKLSTLNVKILIDLNKLLKDKVITTDLITKILFDKSSVIIKAEGAISLEAYGADIKDFPISISNSLASYMAPSQEPQTVCK